MICSTCGTPLEPSARFCQRCGAPIAAPAYPPPSSAYPPPAPPAWTGSTGPQRLPKRERSTRGVRIASALLLFLAAAFTLAGIFPDYYDNGWSITKDLETLVMSIGYVVVLTLVAIFLLVARPRRWAAAGGAMALVTATAAVAIRVGDIATLTSFELTGGAGFWLQTVGDLFAASVWILALVILVNSRARIGADLWSLGPAVVGLLGLVVMIVGEAGSRFTMSYTSLGSEDVIPSPGMFTDFGWRNTTQVLMWFTVVLAIALGTFLFPRLAGGWGLLTGAAMVVVLDVLPPLLAAGRAQDIGSFGMDDTMEVGLRAPFAWTIAAVVLLAVGGLIALVAPDRDKAPPIA
jgi:hypothetical protein